MTNAAISSLHVNYVKKHYGSWFIVVLTAILINALKKVWPENQDLAYSTVNCFQKIFPEQP